MELFLIGIIAGFVFSEVLLFLEWDKVFMSIGQFIMKAPHLPRTNKYNSIISELCKTNSIKIKYFYGPESSNASASSADRRIETPYPNTQMGYETAMHEIGHLVHPAGTSASVAISWMFAISSEALKNEICAWLWAYRNSTFKFNNKNMEYALQSYLKEAGDRAKRANFKILMRLDRLAGTNMTTSVLKDIKTITEPKVTTGYHGNITFGSPVFSAMGIT